MYRHPDEIITYLKTRWRKSGGLIIHPKLNPMSANKKWIVITSGDRSINEISADLKKEGFKVEYELEAIGQITGEASDAVQKAAQKIKGITSISPSGDDINIGNPIMVAL